MFLRCGNCGEDKPTSEFHKANTRPRGYQASCKSCARAKDQKRWLNRSKEHIAKRLERERQNKQWMADYKRTHPCTDCGELFHPAAMQFDHLPENSKLKALSEMAAYGLATIQAEIAKCELVCANCHAVRTYNRRHI